MGNISSYGTRTSSAPTDRLFIATSSSDTIMSATAEQIVAGSIDSGLDSLLGTVTGLLPYRGGSAWSGLSIGTEGQVLTVGSGGAPVWAAPSGGGGGGGGGGGISLPYPLPMFGPFLSAAGVWQRPALSAFTGYNTPAAAMATDVAGGPISLSANGFATNYLAGLAITPGTNFTLSALMSRNCKPGQNNFAGIFVGDTASGNFTLIGLEGNNIPVSVYVQEWNGLSSSGTSSVSYSNNLAAGDVDEGGPMRAFQIQGTEDGAALTFSSANDPQGPQSYVPWATATVGSGQFLPQVNCGGFFFGYFTANIPYNMNLWGLTLTSP